MYSFIHSIQTNFCTQSFMNGCYCTAQLMKSLIWMTVSLAFRTQRTKIAKCLSSNCSRLRTNIEIRRNIWPPTTWCLVRVLCICYSLYCEQSWGLRPRSYEKTSLRPASVLVLVLYFWPRSWSWSCSFGLVLVLVLYFGLASSTVVHDKTLCDMIMLKCNKHLCSFVQ